MGFKEDILDDISEIFVNLDEFATEHTLNNRKINCVIDEERFQMKQTKELISSDEGVFQNGMTVFISNICMKIQPHAGEKLRIDGIEYVVLGSKSDMGIYEIDLMKNEEI